MNMKIEYDGETYTIDGKPIPVEEMEKARREHRDREKMEEERLRQDREAAILAVPDKPEEIELGKHNAVLGGKELTCGICGGRCIMYWSDREGQLYHQCNGCDRRFQFYDTARWRADTLAISREEAGLLSTEDEDLDRKIRVFLGKN